MSAGNSTIFSFFRIVLSESLTLPKVFVRKYGHRLSIPICLKLENGDEWKLYWTRRDGVIWFEENGWKKFAQHYAISIGHFLVFDYEGHSSFVVYVYDKSTAEVHYPMKCSSDEENNSEDSTEDSIEILHELPSCQKRKKRKSQIPGRHRQPCKREKPQRKLVKENNKALQKANAFRSENPFFRVVMTPSYVGKPATHVNIPQEFSSKFLKDRDGVTIVETNDERTWPMTCNSYPNRGVTRKAFCSGWKSFAKDNHLQVGDVCVFELKRNDCMSFKVTIYRFKDQSSCPPTQAYEDNAAKLIDKMLNSSTVNEYSGISTSRGFKRTQTSARRNKLNFRVAMCRTYIRRPSYLHVPMRFAMRCFTAKHGSVTLKLNRAHWSVEYRMKRVGTRKVAEFGRGWKEFSRDNNLAMGDVCIFELVDVNKLILLVDIARAARNPYRLSSQVHTTRVRDFVGGSLKCEAESDRE